jgi:hypothetical protein
VVVVEAHGARLGEGQGGEQCERDEQSAEHGEDCTRGEEKLTTETQRALKISDSQNPTLSITAVRRAFVRAHFGG